MNAGSKYRWERRGEIASSIRQAARNGMLFVTPQAATTMHSITTEATRKQELLQQLAKLNAIPSSAQHEGFEYDVRIAESLQLPSGLDRSLARYLVWTFTIAYEDAHQAAFLEARDRGLLRKVRDPASGVCSLYVVGLHGKLGDNSFSVDSNGREHRVYLRTSARLAIQVNVSNPIKGDDLTRFLETIPDLELLYMRVVAHEGKGCVRPIRMKRSERDSVFKLLLQSPHRAAPVFAQPDAQVHTSTPVLSEPPSIDDLFMPATQQEGTGNDDTSEEPDESWVVYLVGRAYWSNTTVPDRLLALGVTLVRSPSSAVTHVLVPTGVPTGLVTGAHVPGLVGAALRQYTDMRDCAAANATDPAFMDHEAVERVAVQASKRRLDAIKDELSGISSRAADRFVHKMTSFQATSGYVGI